MGDVNSSDRHWMRMFLLIPPFFVPVYILAFRWGQLEDSPLDELLGIFGIFVAMFMLLVFAVPLCLSHIYDRPDDAARWQRAALDTSAAAFTTLAILAAARLPITLWVGLVAALALSTAFVALVVIYQRHIKRELPHR